MIFHINTDSVRWKGILYLLLILLFSIPSIAETYVAERTYPKQIWQAKKPSEVDFRRYRKHWRYMWYARRFIEQHLPFWRMMPHDKLLSTETGKGEVFALPGEIYAVYLPNGGQAALDLTECPGRFVRQWYNPRQGIFEGPMDTLSGGKRIKPGKPPKEPSEDWAVLLTLKKP